MEGECERLRSELKDLEEAKAEDKWPCAGGDSAASKAERERERLRNELKDLKEAKAKENGALCWRRQRASCGLF